MPCLCQIHRALKSPSTRAMKSQQFPKAENCSGDIVVNTSYLHLPQKCLPKRSSNQIGLNISPWLSFCFLFYSTEKLICNTGSMVQGLFVFCWGRSLGKHRSCCLPCHTLWYSWVLIKLQFAEAISLSLFCDFGFPRIKVVSLKEPQYISQHQSSARTETSFVVQSYGRK